MEDEPLTSSPGTPSAPQGRFASRWVRLILVAVLVVAVVVTALVVWYFFFRPAGPPPIGPGAPIIPGASIGP